MDKNGQKKSNFEPGYELKSKITVLAEGTRGSLTKQLDRQIRLAERPQSADLRHRRQRAVGSSQPARIAKGEVIYTMGWPLTTKEYGGAWIYGSKDNIVSLGFVTGLDYQDPRLDPQHVLQEFKQHPFIARLLDGGKMIRYGAKTLPYGGWCCHAAAAGDGWMIVGDSASFLNSQRLKGIHLAIKSGMLAAETAFDALLQNNFSPQQLSNYKERVDASWIKDELWEVRNFHQGFENGSGLRHVPHRSAAAHRRPRPARAFIQRTPATSA